jgi:uncharacterized protein YgbK (DUF1537 family)
MEVFVAGLLTAEAAGRRFVYQTAASFVRIRAGIAPRPLLTRAEIAEAGANGGLLVVGSHVERTNAQLARVLALPGVEAVELGVDALIDGSGRDEIARVRAKVAALLRAGRNVVLYTSREHRAGATTAESVAIGRRLRKALCEIVGGLAARPRFLVVKGGSTASDIATEGLGVRRAVVLGQAAGGVPVWRLGDESKYAGLPFVIFPGNVGGPNALAELITSLTPEKRV